jgi:dTDP-4-amino-4,6-dideoxygalactose transaminase
MCQRLRDKVAAFLGMGISPDRVVLASSATAGFQAVLDACRAHGAKSVAITDATWPGMHQAIRHAGLGRSAPDGFADVDVYTDIGGASEIDERDHFPEPVKIHDCCHSWLPAPGRDFYVMSFYPTKLVPGAEGGAVICPRNDVAEEVAARLYCGLEPGAAGRGKEPRFPGRKANMTDVTAALNLEALEVSPYYIEAISEAWHGLALEAARQGVNYRDQKVRPYLFQVDVEGRKVSEVMAELKAQGIPSAWNFRPAGLVTLPCFPGILPHEIKQVVGAVREAHE